MAKTISPLIVCPHCGEVGGMHVKLMGLLALVIGVLLILPTLDVNLLGPKSHFIAVALLGVVIVLKGLFALYKSM